MKWKPMSEMTREEIEFILKDIFDINRVEEIRYNNDNTIDVEIITNWLIENDEGIEESTEIKDEVQLNSSAIMYVDFSTNREDHLKYEQYMIATGYHPLWKDNPYIKKVG